VGQWRSAFTGEAKKYSMTPEQFQQFWLQLKVPLKAEWQKITDSDIDEIQGISQRSLT
jgi:hypothetical protein